MFTEKDIEFIKKHGQSVDQVENQLKQFQTGFPYVKLVSPASPGNGIEVFSEAQTKRLCAAFDKFAPEYKVLKFVPASGAATRMFKNLFGFLEWYNATADDTKRLDADTGFNGVKTFINSIKNFAFYQSLKSLMQKSGYSIDDELNKGNYKLVIEYLLNEEGLNYGKLPKGLLTFHKYLLTTRTAFEEHMIEGANYACDKNGVVRLHFTVSPEHRQLFEKLAEKAAAVYGKTLGLTFDISFSEQKPSTDTIAVDPENKVFRNDDGSLLFRPAGHGALIENLNDLDADIVFVKNIDNIVPDRLKETTFTFKKVIGAYLIELQNQVYNYLDVLESNEIEDDKLTEIAEFAYNKLHVHKCELDKRDLQSYLFRRLNRPIRVCGMVKNEGEPGGGPFWVRRNVGEISLQIVESSQLDAEDETQMKIMKEATHFNPVDLVCSVKDYKGKAFDLKNFVEHETGFISEKSKDGKLIKAMELPGLWNGAMADWITVFVEVPIETFNPVKTINDLLREQHQ